MMNTKNIAMFMMMMLVITGTENILVQANHPLFETSSGRRHVASTPTPPAQYKSPFSPQDLSAETIGAENMKHA
ncbi:hypothetical protein YC2023_074544 [Brassica napus]